MSGYRHRRALIVFTALLFLFLTVEAFLVSAQLERLLMENIRHEAAMQLDLMADAAYEAVLKSDYVTIRTFIERWSDTHDDYLAVRAIAPNGFIIDERTRPARPGARTFATEKSVRTDGRELLRLELVVDFREAERISGSLRNKLFAGAVLSTLILGTALWYALRTMAIRPLEQEITLRERAEEELRHAHDALEVKVRERTADLQSELAERKRVEAELVRREERIHLLLNSTAEGIFGIDTDGVCTFCNPSCLRLLGHAREEDLLGRNMHSLIHHHRPDGTEYPERDCLVYRAFRTGAESHFDDEVFWRADGTRIPIEYWSHPVRDRSGTLIGAVVTFIDITDRKRLESQLVQSQKMEAIGTLAGGVAHDFNNILTAILGYAGILQRKMDNADPLKANISHILDASQRAARLTRSLLAFSRKQIMTPQPIDLNAAIRRVEKLLGRLIGEDVEISMELCDADLVILADGGQLEQVLMNLAANARDAMPHGGCFTVRSEKSLFDAEAARVCGLTAPGEYAVLSVSDTGVGMDERTRVNIFEPFFTTKEVGHGTGLGMSIAYGIVKQHGGAISVYSEPEKGATFKIYLPLMQRPTMTAEQQLVPEAAIRGGTETILIAEDDRAVLTLMRTVLEESGYRILEASDGEEALRVFREHRDSIRLVLLDTIMPKKNGRQAFEAMKVLQPDLRALFMSGYTADIIGRQGLLEPGFDLLQKPVAPADLLGRIRAALDA